MLAHINQGHDDFFSQSAILATKLYPPAILTNLEPRPELVARLERNRHRAMTLISAPAGYGKSTLAGEWLGVSETPGCWVSLDEEDDDPRTFTAYVAAAVQSVFPEIRLRVQDLLETATFPPPAIVARTLLNDLEQLPNRILIVLDDLHVIRSQAVYDIIAELLRHPSPKLHLVLISRRDPPLPLPSLRAYSQMSEIRTRDLRFSSAETARFLAKTLNCEIDDATAAVWTERAEGWAMALNLFTVALRQRSQRKINLDSVPVDSYYLREYFLAEIFDRLDPALKEWLLAIAWLNRFCPALCAAVFDPDAIAAETELTSGEFVQRLRHENLFVIPLDSENRWFRLHHFFQERLQELGRNQYKQNEIALFHKRAGVWFAREGLIDEALRHLVLASDFVGAEELVLQHRYDLMNTEQWHRLRQWLRVLPDYVVERSARLMSTVAILAMHSGDFQKIAPAYTKAEHLLANLTRHSSAYDQALGDLSVIKSFLAIGRSEVEIVAVGAACALQLLPPNASDLRAVAHGATAVGMQMRGSYPSGYRLLQETLKERQWTRPIQTRLMDYLCMVCFMQGDLMSTHAWAQRVQAQSEELRLPESLSYARYFLGVTHYVRCESDAAEPYLVSLIDDLATSAPSYVVMGAFTLLLIRQERGDVEFAETLVDRITAYFRETVDVPALALLRAFDVEATLRRGDLGAAQRKQIGVDFDFRPPLWFYYIPQLTSVKLLMAEGTSDALAAARVTLEEFDARMGTVHRNVARVQALVLLAVVCDAQGDAACADASLSAALALAQTGQLIRPFVDAGPPMADLLQRFRKRDNEVSQATAAFVMQILAALPPSAAGHGERRASQERDAQIQVAASAPPGLLTTREMQILQLLATDLTPAEIAAQNVVSIATVRSQIKSVYRKLDVNSRIEAVNRGRELRLL